ncbi:MAG: aldehyde dehydrogenase family protein [Algoriphagus sp.]|uniref:aldehyde dehydrogenase family protein n=1 Tax=Algoriphagus sp. TaxID=1872435 RepID=UPI002636EE1A|nr:aldehyde dehydrogenase family protein [Algoriphagus sp.]MDG1275866.1 aldehyde dehydrogenase family protein [Algoriphagus sp.]
MAILSENSIEPKVFLNTFLLQKKTANSWRMSTASDRISRLKSISEWIKGHQKDIQDVLFADFHKPRVETDLSEIFTVTSEINHAIKNLKAWMKPKSVSTPLPLLGTSGKIYYEPKGCALIIAPWNYPFNLAIGPLVSALAAGCPAIIKPSELTPNTSSLIEKMISELFDPSEVAVFQGESNVAQELLKLPFDHIFFTGSPAVGKIVMKAAAENLTSVTLELGGKSPVIIDQDANLKDTAEKLVFGKFINCGQTCVAPDYLLVHEKSKEKLLMELKVALKNMYDPKFDGIEKSPDLARIINDRHFERLVSSLKDGIQNGAIIEFGGKYDAPSRFIEPTLISCLSDDIILMEEEIFGPILPIKTFSMLDEAISYINGKPKPLALYYFGSNTTNSSRVIQETSSGNAMINDCVIHFLDLEMPFGGVNNSGIGKAHGHYGFLAFSNEKGVLKQRVGLNNATLLRPPYGAAAQKIVQSLIKWF